MPAYPLLQLTQFQTFVDEANTHFTESRSSLRTLLAVLKDAKCTDQRIANALGNINLNKAKKYWKALLYLRRTRPNMRNVILPGGNSLNKTNAVLMTKTPLPPNYNHDFSGENVKGLYSGPNRFQMVTPTRTRFLDKTLEHFIWESNDPVGVITIHLGRRVDGMETMMNGISAVDHISSIMTIAAEKGGDICCLHLFPNTPVCPELRTAYDKFTNKLPIFEPKRHEGGHNPYFKAFALTHPVCVVLGWDADICAASNVLGGASLTDNGKLIAPLITLTNILTARVGLVTTGMIGVQGWGVLRGT